MANEEHLAILKQGVEVWNEWRRLNRDITPNLNYANLIGADLSGIDLNGANLIGADLNEANLRAADLRHASLRGAHISRIDLTRSDLIGANLSRATLKTARIRQTNLSRANLRNANLTEANLSQSDLSDSDLRETELNSSNLSSIVLDRAVLSNAQCNNTIFINTDLSTARGLDSIQHFGPSYISVDTLFRSRGRVPERFLRGCGVPEDLIRFLPSFMENAIQFYSCFISYSHADAEFARRLHDRLQGEGIRCWLDEHQLNPGDQLHPTIYEAIRVYDKVLLCCSQTSLKSWWVEKEFGNAINKEESYKENVLIPLNLDGYLFTPPAESYITNEIKKRLAADFTAWKDHDGFEKAFKSVVKALRTDGGKLPPPEPKLKPKR